MDVGATGINGVDRREIKLVMYGRPKLCRGSSLALRPVGANHVQRMAESLDRRATSQALDRYGPQAGQLGSPTFTSTWNRSRAVTSGG